ncbi:MAG: thymidine phosphorylase [Anaerolineae bacterium]
MRAVDILARKRDGETLSTEEIRWIVEGYTRGDVPDYQMSAFLMAVYLRGMTRQETVDLTLAMADSGEKLDLSDISDYWVDKHSSGGVGDKTSLVVLPLVASCGVPVAKMSGRGLGFSGGTLDKLEAIRGYQVNLSAERFRQLARENGIVLAGQSLALAPADGKMYALRDVTATVSGLPLIASSIMSKKIAAGANGIVLDVKVGRGAFMATLEDGRRPGADDGRHRARRRAAGDCRAVGHESSRSAKWSATRSESKSDPHTWRRGSGDLREHSLAIAGHMLRLAGRGANWTDDAETRRELAQHLDDGSALAKFRLLVEAQGGDVAMVDDPSLLPQASIVETFSAAQAGYVSQTAADDIAWAAFELGAGREKKGDPIDLAVGLKVHVKVGDRVEPGMPLVTIYASDAAKVAACRARLSAAFAYSDTPVEPLPLFYGVVR